MSSPTGPTSPTGATNPASPTPRCFLVGGLGFGDEGKGSIVDFLARRGPTSTVVRFNGGPQAAHHVVLPAGAWHCFSQFGSGTLVPGVRTYLSRHVIVEPTYLLREAQALRDLGVRDAMRRVFLSPECTVLTPYHKLVGQLEELARGPARASTTGLGVGNCARDREGEACSRLQVKDFARPARLREQVLALASEKVARARDLIARCADPRLAKQMDRTREQITGEHPPEKVIRVCRNFYHAYHSQVQPEPDFLPPVFETPETIIFEGAQGALLDPRHGFPPFVTKTDCTFAHALQLVRAYNRGHQVTRVGVTRCYATRHGRGPLVTEDARLDARQEGEHNRRNAWQGKFRVGWFDLVATRHALEVMGGVDVLAVTCVDRLAGLPRVKLCRAYRGGPASLAPGKECPPLGTIPADLRAERAAQSVPEYESFPGWSHSPLPAPAPAPAPAPGTPLDPPLRHFLNRLEENRGLHARVAILSFGASHRAKIEMPP